MQRLLRYQKLKRLYDIQQQKRAITQLEIIIFIRQIATLIAAGISIMQSLTLLEKSQHALPLRDLVTNLKQSILAGKSLSQALQAFPQYFNATTCQLILLGEQTGKLHSLLLTLADYAEKQYALKKRLQGALFYPIFISVTASLMSLSMLLFVIPRFAELFTVSQVELPLITKMIFYCSSLLLNHGWILLLLACALVARFLSLPKGKMQRHFLRLLMQLPPVKQQLHKIQLAHFARHLAITFSAGLSVPDGLHLSVHALNDPEFAIAIARLRYKITSGLALHQAMEAQNLFPPLMVQMIKIGEESALLEQMLTKIADFFEADIDRLINKLSALLEPLIMLVLGVVIGLLVIGLYLPIFKLGSTL